MTAQENVALVERAFAALGSNDMARFRTLLADDVEWRAPGPTDVLPFAGTHRGPEAVAKWWRQLRECEEALSFTPKAFIPHEDEVLVVGEGDMRVRKTGKELSGEWVHIYTVEDGKITKFREFYDTAQEVRGYEA
jgi:uncharacterized protein